MDFAETEFGKKKFGEVGIVIASTTDKKAERRILSNFNRKVSHKEHVTHNWLAGKGKKNYPVVFNVYGAPAVMDILAAMHDGGCRNIIFIGWAYGFDKTEVGDIVLPTKSYHFDGIYSIFDKSHLITTPNKELLEKVGKLLEKNGISYVKGKHISVPSVSFQLPHANQTYKKISPLALEMELAACLSRARDLGMRAVGILIISDTMSSSIISKEKKRIKHKAREKLLKAIIPNIEKLNLPRLKTEKEFKLDEHLASIIEDGSGVNVYRNK